MGLEILTEDHSLYTGADSTANVRTRCASWQCPESDGWVLAPQKYGYKQMVLDPEAAAALITTGQFEILGAGPDHHKTDPALVFNLASIPTVANQARQDYKLDYTRQVPVRFGGYVDCYITSATAGVTANSHWALPVQVR